MSKNLAITGPGREKSQLLSIGIDQAISELASRQNGRVSRGQLAALGITDNAIAYRVQVGRLHRLRHGLYAVGHRGESQRSRHRSALLAVGDDGILSHLSSAAELKIRLPAPVVVDVTSPRQLVPRDGIRLHRRVIDPSEIREVDGLPLTSPSQTLFDLGTMLGAKAHAKTANQAFVERLVTIVELHGALVRNQGRKGTSAFRRLLGTLDPDGRKIRSPLEARLSAFLRARGFPPWESNQRLLVGGEAIEADVLWRPQRVIVEADGRDPHLAPLTFASDRRRDRRLAAERWHPVRVTSIDLSARPDELDLDLRMLLGLTPRQ